MSQEGATQRWDRERLAKKWITEAQFNEMYPPTVKRVALDGTVEDTYLTEAEHNGFRATQARMLDAPTKAPAAPANQGALL